MESKQFFSMPNTNGRYAMNESGELFRDRKKVTLTDKTASIDVYDGTSTVVLSIEVIAAICFCNISVAPMCWRYIDPVFTDGDASNLTSSNLTYMFLNGPVEVPSVPGFYYVKDFTRYCINRDGVLMSLRGFIKPISWTITKAIPKKKITGGYRITSLKKDAGKASGVSRHRLLCLTFKADEAKGEKPIVNHLNGVPGDDRLDNLEWTTYSGNTKHAYDMGLHSEKVRPVLMWDMNTDTITRFDTIVKCYTAIGKDENFISRRLAKKKAGKRYSDGLVFKYDDGKPWGAFDQYTDSRGYRFVMAKNVFTNEVSIYDSQSAAASALGIKRENITFHMKSGSVSALSGYVFRWASDYVIWPKHTDHQLELYRRYPERPSIGVLVTWVKSGESKLYFSSDEAAEALGKGRLVITRLAVSGKLHLKDGFTCSYVKPNIEY